VYGSCIDAFVKSQSGDCEPGDRGCPSVYMYLFTHRSEFEPLPFWMGKNVDCGCLSFVLLHVSSVRLETVFKGRYPYMLCYLEMSRGPRRLVGAGKVRCGCQHFC